MCSTDADADCTLPHNGSSSLSWPRVLWQHLKTTKKLTKVLYKEKSRTLLWSLSEEKGSDTCVFAASFFWKQHIKLFVWKSCLYQRRSLFICTVSPITGFIIIVCNSKWWYDEQPRQRMELIADVIASWTQRRCTGTESENTFFKIKDKKLTKCLVASSHVPTLKHKVKQWHMTWKWLFQLLQGKIK